MARVRREKKTIEHQPAAVVAPVPVAVIDDAVEPEPVRSLVLVVTSKANVFRRAGRVFTRSPVRIDPSTLSEADFAAITGEPMLRCELVEVLG